MELQQPYARLAELQPRKYKFQAGDATHHWKLYALDGQGLIDHVLVSESDHDSVHDGFWMRLLKEFGVRWSDVAAAAKCLECNGVGWFPAPNFSMFDGQVAKCDREPCSYCNGSCESKQGLEPLCIAVLEKVKELKKS